MRAHRILALAALQWSFGCALINAFDGPSQGDAGVSDGGAHHGSWSWQGPTQIDRGLPLESDAPRLAVATDGSAWVVWQEWNNSLMTGTIWAVQRPAGAAWGTPQELPLISGWAQSLYPEVAVLPSGEPLIAYEADNGSTSPTRSIRAVQLTAGTAVMQSDIVRVDATDSNSPELSQGNSLAVDESGHAILAWGENDGIFASASANGAQWSSPLELDTNTLSSWATISAAASSGTALVGWSRGSSVIAKSAGLTDGTLAPGALQTLTTGTSLPGPAIAMRGGKGLAVWQQTGGLGVQRWNAGWGSVSSIPDSQLDFYPGVALAVNSTGQAVVVWRHAVTGATNSYAGELWASFFDGTTWTAPGAISLTGTSRMCWWASVDINDAGAAVASWADFDETGTYTRIWANVLRFSSGTPTWQGPAPIDTASPDAYLANTPQNVRDISVGLTPDGSVGYVVYMQHQADMTPRTWVNWLE